MSTIITGLIGMALMIGFLGFFVVWVKAVPLVAIILLVVGLMIYDFWLEVRGQATTGYRR
jgi:hypothetical protein